ncbi:MAG: DUF488 family protein [Actinophytocola sp.]|nr:DUF488 family protein [Actinophytocola sp.]
MRLLTVGHGTADATELTRLLRDAGVRRLVDVRTAPGSRHNPDANRDAMAHWLPDAGIAYRWDKRLGGWRSRPNDSPDTALRNASFGGYATHMRTTEFLAAIDDLLTDADKDLTTVMCAESVWWRCHRKLIADFLLLARGIDVEHLMPDGALRPHRPSPEACLVRTDRVLVYDAGQARLSP